MSSPLFSFPPGLLGYLRQKVGGQAPDKFGDTLTPVFDIGDLYGTPENVYGQNAAAANATLDLIVVPNNERWALLGFSAICTQAAGLGVANVLLTSDSGPNSLFFVLSDSRLYTGTAVGGQFALVADLPSGRPLILEPGSRLRITFLIGSTYPAAWIIDGSARIYRMPI